jgi:ABC-2 type transport system permease protein
MTRLIAGEFGKLFSTRTWLWLLLGTVALTVLYASLAIAFGDDPDNPSPPLSTPDGQRLVLAVGQGAGSLMAVLGAIGVTSEFRYRTATTTFLATPRRWRVVLAKLVAYPVVGLGFGVASVVATLAVAVPWLSAKDIDVSLTAEGIPATLAGVVLAMALFGALGVGVGALLREQVATVVGMLVFLFVAEPVMTRVPALGDWTRYLPGPAAQALGHVTQAGQTHVAAWVGGLVLAGYGLVFALVATVVNRRRDIN